MVGGGGMTDWCPVNPSKRLPHFAWCRKICIKCKWCRQAKGKRDGVWKSVGKTWRKDELPRLPLWLFVVLCDIIFIKRIIGASLAYPVSAAQRTRPTPQKKNPYPPLSHLCKWTTAAFCFSLPTYVKPPTPFENMLLFFCFLCLQSGAIFDLKVDAKWFPQKKSLCKKITQIQLKWASFPFTTSVEFPESFHLISHLALSTRNLETALSLDLALCYDCTLFTWLFSPPNSVYF